MPMLSFAHIAHDLPSSPTHSYDRVRQVRYRDCLGDCTTRDEGESCLALHDWRRVCHCARFLRSNEQKDCLTPKAMHGRSSI